MTTGALNPSDLVGVSFWIISAAMVAATFFFWVERDRAVGKWKTSLTVAAMVTGIAAIHYFYMRGVWVDTGGIYWSFLPNGTAYVPDPSLSTEISDRRLIRKKRWSHHLASAGNPHQSSVGVDQILKLSVPLEVSLLL